MRQMVAQRIVGNKRQFALQVFQILNTHDFLTSSRIDYYEVAEPEISHDVFTQVLRIGFRVLTDKRGSQRFCIFHISGLARLQYKGYLRVETADIFS